MTPFKFRSENNGGLSAGLACMWLCVVSEGFSIDSFILGEPGNIVYPTPSPTATEIAAVTPAPVGVGGAYGGVAAVIPGLIEIEEFDEGGEGVAYSDEDFENNGGVRDGAILRLYPFLFCDCTCDCMEKSTFK